MPNPSRRIKIPAELYDRLQIIARRAEKRLIRTVPVAEVATVILGNWLADEQVKEEQKPC